MNNLFKIVFISFIVCFLGVACEEKACRDETNPECENYNPCHAGYISKAEFTISNRVKTWDGWQFFADTMFGPSFPILYFDAIYPDRVTSHTWYLGAQVINQESFARNFENATYPSNITVSHVVTYDELDPCKPNDNGRDSAAVTFRLVGSYFEFVSIGTFRGKHNGSKEYEWTVYPIKENGDTAYTVQETFDFRYVNFHNTGEIADYYNHYPTNRKVSVFGDGSSDPKGVYSLNTANEIVFDYNYISQALEFQFRGSKINQP